MAVSVAVPVGGGVSEGVAPIDADGDEEAVPDGDGTGVAYAKLTE